MLNDEYPFLNIIYETIIVEGITNDSVASHFTLSPNPNFEEAILSFELFSGSNVQISFVINDKFFMI